jgi:hypothetical protein
MALETLTVEEQTLNNVTIVDDIVSKNYLSQLQDLPVNSVDHGAQLGKVLSDSIRMFRIDQLVFDNDEFMVDKFATVYSAVAGDSQRSLFVLIDKTEANDVAQIYLGIRLQQGTQQGHQYLDILAKTLQGQFPGTKIGRQLYEEELANQVKKLDTNNFSSVSTVSVIPSQRTDVDENQRFVQGLDKLINGIQDESYMALLLAAGASNNDVAEVKAALERLYTDLVPMEQTEFNRNWSVSEGMSAGYALTVGGSYTKTDGRNSSTGRSTGTNVSHSDSRSSSDTEGTSTTNSVNASRTVSAGVSYGGVGAGVSDSVGVGHAKTKSKSHTESRGTTDTVGTNESKSETTGTSHSTSETTNSSRSENVSRNSSDTFGTAQTITMKNKWISNILEQIDEQLKRVKKFESSGMWYVSAYFMSRDSDVAESAARTYRAILQGEQTGIEVSAVNTWYETSHAVSFARVVESIAAFQHPVFEYGDGVVTPAVMLSGDEVALSLALPQESVPGMPVISRAPFALEVNRVDGQVPQSDISVGHVFRMGEAMPTHVGLDKQSMAMHTFITGATGSGKSTAVYKLLDELRRNGVKFMVVEPAKGEYKHVFGNMNDVSVYGTNPLLGEIIRINPFKFAEGIHVLEHVDRLIDIFNVAWPMEAAMPAILKKAILTSYENVGWNLLMSSNEQHPDVYPNFVDVVLSLKQVINSSAYSAESKGDYTGALVTRVESLANGLNQLMFTADDLSDQELFDENVILDLSRVGSSETKSLVMGLLVLRLNEYRMSESDGMNVALKHLTVLEEAHNLLKNTQKHTSGTLLQKSVEMITSSIAEMRTYGEGFVIADQSPATVDLAAIRNTNTKLIMRLPDDEDRQLAGKSMALNDKQIDELATLPKGVAVIYQNDWLAAVPTKIEPAKLDESMYKGASSILDTRVIRQNIAEDLHAIRMGTKVDKGQFVRNLNKIGVSSAVRLRSEQLLESERKITVEEMSPVYAEVFPTLMDDIHGPRVDVIKRALDTGVDTLLMDNSRLLQEEITVALMHEALAMEKISAEVYQAYRDSAK